MTESTATPAPPAEAAPLQATVDERLAALLQRVEGLAARLDSLEARLASAAVPPAAPRVAAPVPAPLAGDDLAQIRALLQRLFAVASVANLNDTEQLQEQFVVYKELVHHDRQGSPLLDGDLFKYKWLPFLGRWRDYLGSDGALDSFQIERLMPERIEARTEVVKLHLVVRGGRRMSPPVQFRRDAAAANSFRIEQMSI
ncbi:MAG: hypothetical protein HY902_15620 [Deltaproteobacteria bacterium]|nr:hypothetical protein [Deltaproteobacteria bacterium]